MSCCCQNLGLASPSRWSATLHNEKYLKLCNLNHRNDASDLRHWRPKPRTPACYLKERIRQEPDLEDIKPFDMKQYTGNILKHCLHFVMQMCGSYQNRYLKSKDGILVNKLVHDRAGQGCDSIKNLVNLASLNRFYWPFGPMPKRRILV